MDVLSRLHALPGFVAAFALWAGCGSPDCASLAGDYAAAKEEALVCDPTAISPCAAVRPQVVWLQDGSTVSVEGLDTCLHSVNAARVGHLDEALAKYLSRGCRFLQTPLCAPTANNCVESAPGRYTCAP